MQQHAAAGQQQKAMVTVQQGVHQGALVAGQQLQQGVQTLNSAPPATTTIPQQQLHQSTSVHDLQQSSAHSAHAGMLLQHQSNVTSDAATAQQTQSMNAYPTTTPPSMIIENYDEWDIFAKKGITNEMLLSVHGKKMVPGIRLKFDGLIPNQAYMLSIDFEQIDDKIYTNSGSDWIQSDSYLTKPLFNQMFVHPLSPILGSDLMSSVIKLDDVRLSTDGDSSPNIMALNPRCYYQIAVQLTPVFSFDLMSTEQFNLNSFTSRNPNLRFMAVKDYKNSEVKNIKSAFRRKNSE